MLVPSKKTLLLLSIPALLCAGVLLAKRSGSSYSEEFTCSRCRALKTVEWDRSGRREEKTAKPYTAWFNRNFPEHECRWCSVGRVISKKNSWLGSKVEISETKPRHRIWTLSREEQKNYLLSVLPAEIETFYGYLDSEDPVEQEKAISLARPLDSNLVVRAKLLEKSGIPTLAQIAPYTDALIVCSYQVGQVLKGSLKAKTIRVAEWAIASGKKRVTSKPGSVQDLTLVPFDSLKGLKTVYRSDDLDIDNEAPFYVSWSLPPAAVQGSHKSRFDYVINISPAMRDYWAIRSQLELVVVGNSQIFGLDTGQLHLSPKGGPTALTMAAAGSHFALQNLIISEYLLKLPRLKWILWGLMPRFFNQNHWYDWSLHSFMSSPGYKHDISNLERLWPVKGSEFVTWNKFENYSEKHIADPNFRPSPRLPEKLTKREKLALVERCNKVDFIWNEDVFMRLERTVKLLEENEINVILFFTPLHPCVAEAESVDSVGTGRRYYAEIKSRLSTIAGEHEGVSFADFHRGGNHGLGHECFNDIEHLNLEEGMSALNKMLADKIREIEKR